MFTVIVCPLDFPKNAKWGAKMGYFISMGKNVTYVTSHANPSFTSLQHLQVLSTIPNTSNFLLVFIT